MASRADNGDRKGGVPWRIVGWGGAAVLLSLPLILQAPWTILDYVFAAVMFGIVGSVIELAVRTSGNPWYRGGAVMAAATAFLLVWVNGAVGIIGEPGNPANLMFPAVIAIALVGAMVARFRADGMARAMAIAAIAEALVAGPVVAMGLGASEPPGTAGIVLLIAGFTAMWAISAYLFKRAVQ